MKIQIHSLAQRDDLQARLVRGGIGSTVIHTINRALALMLGIVLARSLGAKEYGIYVYTCSIMSLLMVLAEAGVPTLLMREVASSLGREEWGLLRGALYRGGQFVGLVATTVALLGLLALWGVADRLSPQKFHTAAFMLFLLPISTLSKTIGHALRGLQRIVLGHAIETLIRPLFTLIFVSGCFILWPGLREPQYAMAAQLVSSIIVLLIGTLSLWTLLPTTVKSIKAKYRSRHWLNSALPFMLIGGAQIINSQTDILMLGWFATAKDVGIYRVAVQGISLVVFSLHVANTVVAPHLSRLYAQGDMARLQHVVTQSARIILLTTLPIALAFILAGEILVTSLFGSEFAAAYIPLAILAAGQLVNNSFGLVHFLLTMTGHENICARFLWLSVILNIIINAVLIPLYGTVGAAIATTATLSTYNLLLYRQGKQRLGVASSAFTVKLTDKRPSCS